MSEIKFLAYYLPQFHPIPENDKWWGKGFTEWTNVKKAKPLFRNHYQPIKPSKLGYYDLLLQPEVQEKQAQLALENGVDGFIYYQYWFGENKMLLEKPAEQMLKNKKINIPFCFCWANETWKGIWHGLDNPEVLIEQTYNGEAEYRSYFNYLLPFFKDSRYILIENKPMFHVYKLEDIPDLDLFINVFDNLAIKAGFDGIHLISTAISDNHLMLDNSDVYGQVGLDVFFKMRYKKKSFFPHKSLLGKAENKIKRKLWPSRSIGVRRKPLIFDYAKGVSNFNIKFPNKKYISCVFPNWDNSPRSGKKSLIFKNATPMAWKKHLEAAVSELKRNPNNPQFIIIKSWNEWAEGNYLEPDEKFGLQWLKVIKEVKEAL
ncbi:glycoside hydrolase family 99-like domain-containing protein [Algibacter aquimarinus]|uniref:Glycoside hydrolase family 99-like domain-containing protein n=1 Tax=Algibacter aquimarinus TaxID=1136748 RepID=A0ABP9HQQ2_9FLAO